MGYTVDPRVEAYINSLPDWQQAICRKVRNLVHAADAESVISSRIVREKQG
jgi:hypothetical protein